MMSLRPQRRDSNLRCTYICTYIAIKVWHEAGLPDGTFSNQNSQFGYILEGLAVEEVVYFMAIRSIIRPFGIFCVHLVYFVSIWYILLLLDIFFPI
jgi:hypothetical protein